MFIPINAKADIKESKKGKLTPAQNAQLNAWCLSKKTGILNCLEKCEAEQLSYTATNNIATVVFKKGYIVICGRLVECEVGTRVNIETPTIGSVDGKIIVRYNLSNSKEEEFVVTTKSEDLIQEDLNDNPITGVYEFLLYEYTATPSTVTLKERNFGYIKSVEEVVKNTNSEISEIKTRLTSLGFNSLQPFNGILYVAGAGSIGTAQITAGNSLSKSGSYKEGNFVNLIITVYLSGETLYDDISTAFAKFYFDKEIATLSGFVLDEKYRPKTKQTFFITSRLKIFYRNRDGSVYFNLNDMSHSIQLAINTDGTITLQAVPGLLTWTYGGMDREYINVVPTTTRLEVAYKVKNAS